MGLSLLDDAPDGGVAAAEALRGCIQCGTCSAVCPMIEYMDQSPRLLNGMLLAGRYDDVLRSRSIWVCTSCYACTVECPQQLPLTDTIYALKRASMSEGLYPRHFPTVVMAHKFVDLVDRRGRSSEFWVSLALSLRTHPALLLRYAPLAVRLLRRGRMRLRYDSLQHPGELRRMLDALELTGGENA